MTPRWRLFTKYAAFIIALVTAALLASGATSLYFSYRENQDHLIVLQREKALAAATRIEQYINDIEHQLGWTALPQVTAGGNVIEQRRYEYLKLLRQAPAITEVAWLDNSGREQLRVSRLAMDVVGAGNDLSQDPKFREAKGGKTWYSPVYFRKETEPYMTISRPAGGAAGGTTVAEVNLKFVWEVVSRIQIGKAGLAYVVNSAGTLIAHPDISLVLQKTDLSRLPQVTALVAGDGEGEGTPIARNIKGEDVLTAHARIPTLNWTVFVELPLAEAFAPLYASIQRTGLLLLAGLILSVLASVYLARLMVNPIRALQQGAAQIGAGQLDQRIEVHTGDELEALATQFNTMAERLKESYAGLERKVEERTAELTESLEQQTATAEILRVISSSPTDIQPVLDAVAESAARLCAAQDCVIRLLDGETHSAVAHYGGIVPGKPSVVSRDTVVSRAVLQRRTIQANDAQVEFADSQWVAAGLRTILAVPLLREGEAIGAIVLRRLEASSFTDKQINLLETFAAQAVIAIENVRLFKELQARNAEVTESLEQQTATAEILRVISGSLTDTQPVFDAIVRNCGNLFESSRVVLWLISEDRLDLNARAVTGGVDLEMLGEKLPLDRGSAIGVCVLDGRMIHLPDLEQAAGQYPRIRQLGLRWGYHSGIYAPLLRDGRAVGGISVLRRETGAFDDKGVALLNTFADQAVIAIENVRLFKELQARNAEVTESLEQQTATAEILSVISSSPTNVMPVLEAVTHRAAQLCDAPDARLYLVENEALRYVTGFGKLDGARPVVPLTKGNVTGRAVLDRAVVHVEDLAAAFEEFPEARVPQQLWGHRTTLAVPLVREGKAFGGILLRRKEVRPFTDKQVELVRTFADQATIAIENVRLFNEIQDKSRQLEVANKHKSEFLTNMSHELRTPLNAIIGFSEVLVERMFGEMNPKQEEYLRDIHSSGHHLLSLINDILDLSKVEAGRMELELSEFHVSAALANAMTLVRERAQTHGIALKLDVDKQLGEVRADERKFKQIVLNLLSNAVKFTPDGGRIDVEAHMNGEAVQVSVKDTGVGIAKEDQEAVFEEFRQVGRNYTNKQEGTGLGLALTRRFVELHGGKIWLESEPGKGSTFTFTLPVSRPA